MADYKVYNLDQDEVMDALDCEFGIDDFPLLTAADYNTIGKTILGEDQTKTLVTINSFFSCYFSVSALKEASPKAVTPAKIKKPVSNISPEDKIKLQNRANRERDHILIKLNAKPAKFQNPAYYEMNDSSNPQNARPKYGPNTQIQYYNNPKPKIKHNRK